MAVRNVVKISEAKEKTVDKNLPREIVIHPPKFEVATVRIRGMSPYVQHAFSEKSKNTMIETQMAGHQSRKGKKRDPKDFKEAYEGAKHISREGWCGIPCAGFRNGLISACRVVGFQMTRAKLTVFIEADGFDAKDGTPLVKITKGKPREHFAAARNDNGSTDIRCRPMWDEGWEADVRIRWDADQFSASDVVNLFHRVGMQVGIGEGRPDSRNSSGLGWGLFQIAVD